VEAQTAEAGPASEDDVRRLEDMASEAPVIRLVHDLITRAVEAQASDIHVEPREDSVRVRYRIDGVLATVETLPPSLRAAVTSRIKIMANLNIAERRLPQDGRVKSTVRGKPIDLRISTMPTMLGESVVLRILDRSSVELDFERLGFHGATLETFTGLLAQPNGIILVTGPTGSGKTTTLYTALSRLNKAECKLFTVEDPIEYQLAGISQIQVQPKIGLTFAHALRSILRQDPDIIMVGEIRDLETAQMAIQASLTGHLVLSTLHTNGAAASLTRLLDMGVDDYLLASTLTGVLAQRLVRRLCGKCAVPDEPPPFVEKRLGGRRESLGLRRKVGCQACRQTGYAGRTTISELLVMNDALRRTLLERGSESAIEAAAVEGGMVAMFDDGLAKALGGETTIEEVLRVTRIS
jgi:general secretion pathway protein E